MHLLANDHLSVELLDPAADHERFGVRYCTGGYIFQVTDARVGPLLTGPTYPDTFDWIHGQGIPDAFNLAPLRGPARTDTRALVLGIGVCDLEQRAIVEPCTWEVSISETSGGGVARYRTTHAFDGYEVELARTVTLSGRSVISWTEVSNTGQNLPISWFPHPFYPQPEAPELFRTDLAIGIAENDGFRFAANGFVERVSMDERGRYQALELPTPTHPMTFLQRHPALGLVAASTDFAPTFVPIWGNPRTFSFEPFVERTVAKGHATAWTMTYDF